VSGSYVRFQDFVLQFEASSHGGFRARVIKSPFGEGSVRFSLPSIGDSESILRCGPSSPSECGYQTATSTVGTPRPLKIGSELFKSVFHGQVRMLFDKSRGQIEVSPDQGLRLMIKLDPSDEEIGALADQPWELLCDGETESFLALSRQTSLVRYLDVPHSSQPIPFTPPLRILAVAASPRGLPPLDLEKEMRHLEELNRSASGVEVRFLTSASVGVVRKALSEDTYHVVHFMGHGTFDHVSDEGMLAFEGSDGAPEPVLVSGKAFAAKLTDLRSLGLVVLNACSTARTGHQGGAKSFRGVATALVLGGIPAVVAMQCPISDLAAIGFSAAFYRNLARGDSIDEALAEGRQAIHSAKQETFEWATPVLFLRIHDGTVFMAKPTGQESESVVERLARLGPVGLNSLKGLFLLAASLGSLLPGFAFFLNLSPPFIPGTALVTALAAALVAIAFAWPRKRSTSDTVVKKEFLRAAAVIFASFFLAVSYISLYKFTTVVPPVPPPTVSCQTGFGLSYLTESARLFIKENPALANPQDLMLAYAAFAGCRSDLIWESWSILTAGVVLITHFSAASLLWALGFAWLARLLSSPSRRNTLALIILAISLCSCMSERLPSSHASFARRIKHLEVKVKELDDRKASTEAPAQQ
jgi:hypothetical protein